MEPWYRAKIDRATYDACLDPRDYRPKSGSKPRGEYEAAVLAD